MNRRPVPTLTNRPTPVPDALVRLDTATHTTPEPIFAEVVAALGLPPTRRPIVLELHPMPEVAR